MKIRTLKDIQDLKGKKVLLRVDFNVPLKENGDIQDDTRITESLETINYLREHGAKLIIISHLGRPDGKVKEDLRLTKIAKYLSELLGCPVKKLDEVIGTQVTQAVSEMSYGDIIMLENVRFEPGEEACDETFTSALAALGDIFVNDAFSAAHRRHASTAGIAEHLPAYGGFLMEREILHLAPIVEEEPIRPLTLIFGGAKIDTKIDTIKYFIEKADHFLIGGALANTFLAAAGYNIGYSLFEKDKLEVAREIMLECEKHHERFILPHDVTVASEISDDAETANVPIEDVLGDMRILDIGKWTAEKFANIVVDSGTVIWNGPLGMCEHEPFQYGTKIVATAMAKTDCISIIGGGDTIDALKRINVPPEKFTHISTGGGACMEFLAGKALPGIEVLKAE
ncbi:MAG: phosphoglycerate kinase [Candidatus Peregrinibacteria bacterium]